LNAPNHTILIVNLQEANLKEVEMISKFDTFIYGYNSSKGGEGGNGIFNIGKKRPKISQALMGHKVSKNNKTKTAISKIRQKTI
jgi:hypothetical protein